MYLYSAVLYDALAVLHRRNFTFVAFSFFLLPFCIPLTLSVIPLSLVVMCTVRLSHVWGSHCGLDEGMINDREKAGMTCVRVTARLALFRTGRVRRSSPDTPALLFIEYTDIFLSLPLCLSRMLSLSYSTTTRRHLQLPRRNQVGFNLKDAFSSFHLQKVMSHLS